jgi:phosphopantothenoylcysteine decarboxylase/phosphopantothenate--cysteine ligase
LSYHPVNDIKSIVSRELEGKCILVAVTGSVAAYKSVDYVRGLIKRGAEVHVMLTKEAAKLVSPLLFEWATGNPVITELTGMTEHIYMARKCDALVIVPATLNILSKISQGITDENVSLTAISFIGYHKKILIVPAMHRNMYETSYVKKSIESLEKIEGIYILKPRIVDNALKIHEVSDIVRWSVPVILRGHDLRGLKVLITAGATREYLDRVRFITNPGSGRMGVELAVEAYSRGAKVTLIAGSLKVRVPEYIDNIVRVETTEEMADVMEKLTSTEHYDIIISPASPVDFKPATFYDEKIRSGRELTVTLKPTPKVLSKIVKRPSILVAFVADVVGSIDELREMAYMKMKKHNAEMAVANNVGRTDIGFGSEFNEVLLVYRDGRYEVSPKMRKEEISRFILDRVRELVAGGDHGSGIR